MNNFTTNNRRRITKRIPLYLAVGWQLLIPSLLMAAGASADDAQPQDRGLPYTRSAKAAAVAKVKDSIGLFAGSRYALVYGYKVRLDEADLTGGEAVMKDGKFLVPAAFAGVLGMKSIRPDPAPAYLADRWVYTFKRPAGKADLPVIVLNHRPYIDALALAHSLGRKTSLNARGLLLIGQRKIEFRENESALLDTVISQFDTPEKFADPEIAQRWLKSLKEAGTWRDRAKPDAVKLFAGPETDWPLTPMEKYDLSGFNAAGLGSKVPPPGVHPRVFFSPEDVPGIAQRLKTTKSGQMAVVETEINLTRTIWKPDSAEGVIYKKLVAGDTAHLQWAKPEKSVSNFAIPGAVGVWNTPHRLMADNNGKPVTAEVLSLMAVAAQYCLLTGNEARGREVAAAVCNYFKLREPLLDEYYAISDAEFAATLDGANNGATHFRQMHGFAPGSVGVIYDFSAKWMDESQKKLMRRYIAKAVYGRRAYGMNGSLRWADVNWVSWDTAMLHSAMAIEGEEGYDPEIYDISRKIIRAWLDWGIDANGTVYETNGKNVMGLQMLFESMVVLARRGDNYFGHPHLRQLTAAQVQSVTPDGRVNVNNGTWGDAHFGANNAGILKFFFPQDACADFLLRLVRPEQASFESPEQYREFLEKGGKRLRLPGWGSMFTLTMLFDGDWAATAKVDGKLAEPWEREHLKLPLTFDDPLHGLFITRSGNEPDAAFLMLEARPDKWLGAGHFQADAGAFHFAALGVNWGGFALASGNPPGRKSLVTIDGTSIGAMPPRVKYIGASESSLAAFAAADTKYAYDWIWMAQPIKWSDVDANPDLHRGVFEPEPDPEVVKCYAGTERYKMRYWWHTYLYTSWLPTFRATWNPVQYSFRTAGVVCGPHPYALVVDDIKKDAQQHLYEWNLPLGGGAAQGYFQKVVAVSQPGLAANEIILGALTPADPKKKQLEHLDESAGTPRLLVRVLAPPSSAADQPLIVVKQVEETPDAKGNKFTFKKLVVRTQGDGARFKILLIPFRQGEALPVTTITESGALVAWKDQKDDWQFSIGNGQRTRCTLHRGTETCAPIE